jgi:hypothetical protein
MCNNFLLRLLSETFVILRTQRDIIVKVHGTSCEVPLLLLSDFMVTAISSTGFGKILQYEIS